jgi:hypothetical protein
MSDAWASPTGTAGSPPVTNVAQFNDVTRNATLLMKRGGMRLVMAYGVLTGAAILFQVPTWLLTILMQVDPGNLALAGGGALALMAWSVVQFVLSVLVTIWSAGLARPARLLLVDPDQVGGAGSILKMATARFGWTGLALLLYGILTLVGLCFFLLPGLAVIFFLSSAVWLVAATDIELGAAFEKSYKLALANLPVLAAYFGVMLALGLVLGVLNFTVNFAVSFGAVFAGTAISYDYAPLVTATVQVLGPMFTAGLYAIVGYPMMILSYATLAAVETADAGVAVKEDPVGEF